MEPFTVLIVGLLVGAGAGALSAYLGWNRSAEPFDARKFLNGLITGIIAGVVVVLGSAAALQAATDNSTVLLQLIVIVFAVLGVDYARTSITNAIRNARAVKQVENK